MRVLAEIAHTGVVAILIHRVRSLVTVACLLSVLVPFLVGIGISQGVQREAEMSISGGADVYVSGEQFGRPAAIPVAAGESIRAIEGVEMVTPRIVGATTIGRQHKPAVLVGLPVDRIPASVECVQGRMFQDSAVGEVVLGSELARHLQLNVGDRIPPFYRSSQGERVSHVVGIFRSDTSLWQASLIFTSIEYAAAIFDQPQHITDLLVDCRAGYEDSVRDQIRNRVTFSSPGLSTHVRPRVVTREEVRAILPAGLLHREGIFSLHFVVAFAVGILVILVTSGFGLSERRREFGVLKATGWQTDEVLLRGLVESLLLSVIGATLAIIIAFAWLRWFNGYWIAGIFLSGVDAYPHFPIPFRITPMPAVLAAIVSFAIVMTGTLVSTWRSAIVSPMVAMRGG